MLLIACTCGQRMKVPTEALGKTATCVKCGSKVQITADSGVAPDSGNGVRSTKARTQNPAKGPVEYEDLPGISTLLRNRLVTAAQLDEASLVCLDFPQPLWHGLITFGHVKSDDFHKLMLQEKASAGLDLQNYDIPSDVASLLPADFVRRSVAIPVDKLGKLLTLGMPCPLDTDTIAQAEAMTGLRVKPMLCKLDDLQNAIRLHFPERWADQAEADGVSPELIRELESAGGYSPARWRVLKQHPFPALATTAARLQELSSGREPNVRELTDAVALDPFATVYMLAVANSEAYGLPGQVDSVPLAMVLLGAAGCVRGLAQLGSDPYSKRPNGIDYPALIRRSRFCAEAAQSIASDIEEEFEMAAYTAGLLHEIGRVALAEAAPESYGQLTAGRNGQDRLALERRVYGVSTPVAGYFLARKWNLPAALAHALWGCRAVKFKQAPARLTSVLGLAVAMADAYESGTEPTWQLTRPFIDALGVSESKLTVLFQDTAAELAAS